MKCFIVLATALILTVAPAFAQEELPDMTRNEAEIEFGGCAEPGHWKFDLDRSRRHISDFCTLNECGWEVCFDETWKGDHVLVNGLWYEVRRAKVVGSSAHRRGYLILRTLYDQPYLPWWYGL